MQIVHASLTVAAVGLLAAAAVDFGAMQPSLLPPGCATVAPKAPREAAAAPVVADAPPPPPVACVFEPVNEKGGPGLSSNRYSNSYSLELK